MPRRKSPRPPKNPVTDAHVELFEAYIHKWRALLNLMNWRIVRKAERDKRNMAALDKVEHEHKLAHYSVGEDFGNTPVTKQSLESTALHELLHLLLRPMIDVAISAGAHDEAVLEEEHSVITVLEQLLMAAYGDGAGKDEG